MPSIDTKKKYISKDWQTNELKSGKKRFEHLITKKKYWVLFVEVNKYILIFHPYWSYSLPFSFWILFKFSVFPKTNCWWFTVDKCFRFFHSFINWQTYKRARARSNRNHYCWIAFLWLFLHFYYSFWLLFMAVGVCCVRQNARLIAFHRYVISIVCRLSHTHTVIVTGQWWQI